MYSLLSSSFNIKSVKICCIKWYTKQYCEKSSPTVGIFQTYKLLDTSKRNVTVKGFFKIHQE